MTLIFEHIPKTGGSTFGAILQNQYKNVYAIKGLYPLQSIRTFEEYAREKRESFQVIKGHGASVLKKYVSDPLLITFLRHPVERFISQYNFIRKTPQHRSYPAVSATTSIDEYIAIARENNEDNLQTKLLAHALEDVINQHRVENPEEYHCHLLNIAKKHLQQFDYVFFTHQFDLSLMVLHRDLQWEKWPWYRKRNKSNGISVHSLDEKCLLKISELEKYDLELYSFAEKLFQNRSSAKLRQKIKRFTSLNKWYKLLTWPTGKIQRFKIAVLKV